FIKQPLPKGRADGEIVASAQNSARAILKEISRKRS
ncbi:MAG: hypothetical protein QOK03_326, partial [Candidatus Binataceae bacterium]|nr:hypothetical protein [Candidatus Binataceae bacterium]